MRVAELFHRSAQHVVDHHQARVRRNDDSLRRQRAVPEGRHLVVQCRHRRHELTDQTERGVDFERQKLLLGDREHGRQPRARHTVRDDHELGGVLPEALHAADARETGVLEADERVYAFAKCQFERRVCRELVFEFEHFERLAAGADGVVPFAESILEHRAARRGGVGAASIHRRLACACPSSVPDAIPLARCRPSALKSGACRGT